MIGPIISLKETSEQTVRVPIRSVILNVSPILHGIGPFERQEIIQDLKQHLRRSELAQGQLIDTGKGIHLVWDWGECTVEDVDLTSPAEVSGILAQFRTQAAPKEAEPILENRRSHPHFRESLSRAAEMAKFIKNLCHELSTKEHKNGAASWQKRFNLSDEVHCRFGLCHGKLFNLGDRLSGLSLDVATDIARMAPKGGLACGPIVRHVLEEVFVVEEQSKKIKTIGNQLIPSAQIECPLWEIIL